MRTWFITLLCLSTLGGYVRAAEYRIEVLSSDSRPLEGAVVYLQPQGDAVLPAPKPGIMDQVDRQFLPHILVVQRGADVSFPNSDSIKHHVYSFSQAKTFEIRLYKGSSADPIAFDRAGEVELGCNVHDWMLGYIYVVDTPYFARSGRDGIARIEAPEGSYEIGVWHPRIQEEAALKQTMERGTLQHRVQLARPLLAPYDPESAGEFDDY